MPNPRCTWDFSVPSVDLSSRASGYTVDIIDPPNSIAFEPLLHLWDHWSAAYEPSSASILDRFTQRVLIPNFATQSVKCMPNDLRSNISGDGINRRNAVVELAVIGHESLVRRRVDAIGPVQG